MSEPSKPTGAPDEIEVTENMLKAGVAALAYCEPHDSRRSIAVAVYRAMETSRRYGGPR